MKVVINRCYGEFGLSDEAVEMCIRRGMRVTDYSPKGGYLDPGADFVRASSDRLLKDQHYHDINGNSNAFRCNPILVSVVQDLGKKADGAFAELKIVDIPYDGPQGWEIDDYDGMERIEAVHESWA